MGTKCRFVGTRKFSDAPDDDGTHVPSAAMDLRSLMRTIYCLIKQRQPLCDDENAREYWQKVEDNYPTFRQGISLACGVEYDGLKELVY